MKSFLKYVAATVVGLCLTTVIISVVGIVFMAGVMASQGMSSPIEKNSVLRLKLVGTITERADNNPFANILGEEFEGIALEEALTALDKAAGNDNIKGLYLDCGAFVATPAMGQELRDAIVKFKKSGKWVYAYGDNYTKMSYYIASCADSVLLNPHGGLDFSGLASEPVFYKDVLDKIGVKMQVFRVGTYKSAVEPYMTTEMSPANRQQVTSYLGSIWGSILNDVAKSRKLKPEQLNSLADSLVLLADPKLSVKGGLVDKLCYIDEVRTLLRKKCDIKDDDEYVNFVSAADVASSETLNEKTDDQVAVYYAYGEIVDSQVSGFSDEHAIVGKDMIKDLQDLRNDDDVKAVVIRVNSPGGSAFASEQIWHEISLLKAEKPVVISMGGMAASGGYYISCGANRIFAEPTTLTGSIGIFGMIPDASELLTQKIGLKFDEVKTNAMSGFFENPGRPLNVRESAMMQAYVNKGYDLFTSRVAAGRKMKQDSVKVIAEGRVWTGEQALKIGLVDEIGNLTAAVKYAAKLAKVKKYATVPYPAEEDPFSQFFNHKRYGYLDSELRETLGEYYTPYAILKNLKAQSPVQARIPFDPNIK